MKTPAELGMDAAKLSEAQTYAQSKNGAGLVVRNGYQVASWGKLTDRYPVSSVSKAIGAVLLGVANAKHGVQLSDGAQNLYADFGNNPASNIDTGWLDDVTLEQLATHSSGFEKDRLAPRLKFQPATQWVYSDGGANWLADILTVKLGEDLRSVLKREVLDHLGIGLVSPGTAGGLDWRDVAANNPRGTHIGGIPRREFNSGISVSVDAMARIGLLLERNGLWNGTRIVNTDFIGRLSTPAAGIKGLPITDTGGAPDPNYPNATEHHGIYWWNNGDGTLADVPRDAFWAWGLGDHLIVVIPSLQLVAARTSSQAAEGDLRLQPNAWKEGCNAQMCAHYDALEPFLKPLVQSVQASTPPPSNPPPSNPPPSEPPPSEGGGGGGALQWWMLAALCLVRRREQMRRDAAF